MIRSRRSANFLAVGVACALAFGACGGDPTGEELSGSISIDGSSTVAPLTEAIAEEFKREEGGVDVAVGTSGTGGGFTKFCNDEIDIADASRPIKDEEKAACAAKNIEFVEIRVGLDGLAIVTSAENTFLKCLSFETLASIYKDGGAKTWNQADAAFPKADIAIFGPGTDSGTYDYFNEEVLGDPDDGGLKPRSDYTASENDNTLVQGVAGEKNSVGYFGFAYFKENDATLKAIAVAGEDGTCVTPSDETVKAGDYPLSRPLFIYVKKAAISRPEIIGFVEYYLETTPLVIGDVGFTAAPEADYTQGLADLKAAAG